MGDKFEIGAPGQYCPSCNSQRIRIWPDRPKYAPDRSCETCLNQWFGGDKFNRSRWVRGGTDDVAMH